MLLLLLGKPTLISKDNDRTPILILGDSYLLVAIHIVVVELRARVRLSFSNSLAVLRSRRPTEYPALTDNPGE